MDRGIWATWYDLPEEGKEEYLAWLHEVHLPIVRSRPGYLWAAHVENRWDDARKKDINGRLNHTDDSSIPAGNSYLLLRGAASPHVFVHPSTAQLEANWTVEEREMLGRLIGVRTCIFVEAHRVDGPEVATRAPGLTPGPVIQLGSFNIDKLENEEAVSALYSKIRLPLMAQMPGVVGARKLVSIYGWAKHAILYEFVSFEAVKKYFVGRKEPEADKKEWSDGVISRLIHAPGSPSQGKRIWPPT